MIATGRASDSGEGPTRTSPRAARRFSGLCRGNTIQGVFRLTREGI
jgi:hypothetical protein